MDSRQFCFSDELWVKLVYRYAVAFHQRTWSIEQLMKSMSYSYRDRKNNKRNFRRLWITRINAAARLNGLSYNEFINGLKKASVDINRKMLSEIAICDPDAFKQLTEIARKELA